MSRAQILERVREVSEWQLFTYRFAGAAMRTVGQPEVAHMRVKWEGNLLMSALISVYGE